MHEVVPDKFGTILPLMQCYINLLTNDDCVTKRLFLKSYWVSCVLNDVCVFSLPVTCPIFGDLVSGMVNCIVGDDSDLNPGDTCTFTCNDGYMISGSTNRTCQNDGTWNGSNAMCSRGMY